MNQQLTIQELERQNNLLETYLGDDLDGSIFEKIKNNDRLIKNMEGGVNMNKTQLRSELSKVYGVKLSAEEFKNASVAELEAMIVNAKNNINNKVEGVVNMNNVVRVSEEELVARFRKVLNIQEDVVKPVNTHTTNVAVRVVNHMDTKLNSLESKIDQLVKSLSTNRGTTTVATKDYQKDATKLTSLGKTLNKAGKEVEFYGVCETCGTRILSPDVVSYSTKKLGKCTCYDCQKKANNANKGSNVPVHKECSYCKAKITYNNVSVMTASVKKAQNLGLKPYVCGKCGHELTKQTSAPASVSVEETVGQTQYTPDNNSSFGEIQNELLGDRTVQNF